MALPRMLARVNRHVANPLIGLVAGRVPGYGIVVHSGRKSGRVYRTPVSAFRTADGFTIALTYGRDTDWLKNVLAAGGCDLEYRCDTVELTDPTVGHDAAATWAPLVVRQVLRVLDAPYFVQLRVAS